MPEKQLFSQLPKSFQCQLKEAQIEPITSGMSGDQVWRILTVQGTFYLKCSQNAAELRQEQAVQNYLQGRAAAPKTLQYEETEQGAYLLSTGLMGIPASEPLPPQERLAHMALLAQSLKSLHQLPLKDCPFSAQLAHKKQQAAVRVKKNQVDAEGFGPPYLGQSAEALWDYFCQEPEPSEHSLVFTHGDACLPNYIVHQGQFTGWIDLGRAGPADPWQDLALCYRSLERNGYSETEKRYFLTQYGVNFDAKRFRYYCLLDEFF